MGERQLQFDGLRGLAAFYVVLHHMYLEIWPTWRPAAGLTARLTEWLLWGHLAVVIFIVISGYCLALPVIGGKFATLSFYRRRALRILPPYYFGVAFSILLIVLLVGTRTGTQWDMALPITWHGLAKFLFLCPEFRANINHSYWSIGVECKIYLLFPLIVWISRWLGVVTTLALTSAAAFGLALAFQDNHWVVEATVHFLGLFCFGVFAAYVLHARQRNWPALRRLNIWTAVFLLADAATAWGCWYWGYPPVHGVLLDLVAGFSAIGLFVAAGKSDGLLRRCLSSKPLVALGAFSYSLYLVHAPLVQVFWQYGIRPFDFAPQLQFVALLLTMPAMLLCAWGFYWICERPFIPPGRAVASPPSAGTDPQPDTLAARV